MTEPVWIKVENTAKLVETGRMVFRHKGKQILLVQQGDRLFAVNNRCPHEGYPLSEGSLSPECKLTCNWHNWKFDLLSGQTVVGGDNLRHYPLRRDNEGLWIDIQDPPGAETRHKALEDIQGSFQRYEYGRMARELSRFRQAGGSYREAVSDSIRRNYDRFEYGMNHAFAAAADWLALGENLQQRGEEDGALASVLEIISHIAWDSSRQPSRPFSPEELPYDADRLIQAIEAEDEARAVALVRGAVAGGLGFSDLEPALATAALAHYNGFGHSAIYVCKTGQLCDRLEAEATLPLILSLVRHLVYARREDLIPEFCHYADALIQWDGLGNKAVTARDFYGLSVNKTMNRMLQSSADREGLFAAIYQTLARNMLYFDLERDRSTDHPVAQNVNWLNFTHGLTFANAVRSLCGRYPDLWPKALLQLGCFSGRNVNFIDGGQDISAWAIGNAQKFFEDSFDSLQDHGCPEPIVSSHLVKLLTAVKEDFPAMPPGEGHDILLAGVNRFLNSPLKRKHSLRTAKQARQFIMRDG